MEDVLPLLRISDTKKESTMWKRIYLRDYQKAFTQEESGEVTLQDFVHDPLLGLDEPSPVRPARQYSQKRPEGVFRVLSMGDSFTFGDEVGDNETYSHFLEQLIPRGEVLNMGVRSYGIDQSVLKYRRYGKSFQHDLVIVALPVLDYLRVPLDFYRFAKPVPYLDHATGILSFRNLPIPSPSEVYRQLLGPFGRYSLAYLILKEGALHWFHESFPGFGQNRLEKEAASYFEEWDPVMEGLLGLLKSLTKESGASALLLILPGGGQFKVPLGRTAEFSELIRGHLRAIAGRVRLPYIDFYDEFLKLQSPQEVIDRFYVSKNGHIGHFSPEGNQQIARSVFEKLPKSER